MNFKKTGEVIKDLLLDMVIKSAIMFEEDSKGFYEASIDKVNDEKSKNLLITLMNEEGNHVAKLRQLLTADVTEVIKSVDVSDIKLLDENYVEKNKRITSDNSTVDILDIAIDKEVASYKFYSSLSDKTSIEQVKKLFAFLAAEEDNHRNHIIIERNRILSGK